MLDLASIRYRLYLNCVYLALKGDKEIDSPKSEVAAARNQFNTKTQFVPVDVIDSVKLGS